MLRWTKSAPNFLWIKGVGLCVFLTSDLLHCGLFPTVRAENNNYIHHLKKEWYTVYSEKHQLWLFLFFGCKKLQDYEVAPRSRIWLQSHVMYCWATHTCIQLLCNTLQQYTGLMLTYHINPSINTSVTSHYHWQWHSETTNKCHVTISSFHTFICDWHTKNVVYSIIFSSTIYSFLFSNFYKFS